MSMYDKSHYNIVISLQVIKINEKKKKVEVAYLASLYTTCNSSEMRDRSRIVPRCIFKLTLSSDPCVPTLWKTELLQ